MSDERVRGEPDEYCIFGKSGLRVIYWFNWNGESYYSKEEITFLGFDINSLSSLVFFKSCLQTYLRSKFGVTTKTKFLELKDSRLIFGLKPKAKEILLEVTHKCKGVVVDIIELDYQEVLMLDNILAKLVSWERPPSPPSHRPY